MAKTQRDPGLERRWRDRIERWKRSGQTIRDFCRQHHLTEASFYAWRAELTRRDQEGTPVPPRQHARDHRHQDVTATPTFVPVQVVPHAILEVVLLGGVVLRVPPGADLKLVAQLVRELEG